MTNEQIKQNAEAYAELLTAGNKEHYRSIYTAAKEGYETGAHSLDEEIKELKEEIKSLQEQYNTCFDGFKKRGTKLGELMKENVKLRNPWISVEERLPEIDREVYLYHYGHFEIARRVVCKDRIYNRDGTHSDTIEWKISHGTSYSDISKGDYWMPIPELKKG